MPRELERVTVPQGWPDVLVAENKSQLLRMLAAAQRRGELGAVGPLTSGGYGTWYVRVLRLKAAPVRRARWPWIVSGVSGGLCAAGAAGWWLVGAAPAGGAVVAAPGVAAVGLLLLAAGRRAVGRRHGCTITVTHTRR